MSVARHANNAAMIEILNGAAEIRAHFEATGRHEWPIVPDEPDGLEPEVEVPLQRQETDYQPQLVPVSCVDIWPSPFNLFTYLAIVLRSHGH